MLLTVQWYLRLHSQVITSHANLRAKTHCQTQTQKSTASTLVRDGVNALTVRAIGASARAAGPGGRSANRPVRIADDRVARSGEGRRDVVLTCMGFRLVVDARQVRMGGLGTCLCRLVLLKPEAELHVISQELRAYLLIRIEHDPLVVAAVETPRVLARVARRILLCLQVPSRGGHAVLLVAPFFQTRNRSVLFNILRNSKNRTSKKLNSLCSNGCPSRTPHSSLPLFHRGVQ